MSDYFKSVLRNEHAIARYRARMAREAAAREGEEVMLASVIAGMGDTYILPVTVGEDQTFTIPPRARARTMAWRGRRRR